MSFKGSSKKDDLSAFGLPGGRKCRTGAALTAVLFLFTALAACTSNSAYNPKLSDLGGVYGDSYSSVQFGTEVSGRMSEGNSSSIQQEAPEIIRSAENGAVPDNKLLRWGISRRENHQTPAADPGAPQLLKKYGASYLGDTSKSTIYLTFDEGYENGYTPMILDALRENQVKAIFFITGPYLKGQQELVRRMVEEGHCVGNHTIHHPSLPGLDDSTLEEEILGLDRAFQEKFGKNMVFLRPPKGEYSERTLALTQKLGYCNLFWSFAYDDWYRDRIRGPEYARDMVMRNLHNGAVLLLHAVSKDNAMALDSIIKDAAAKGYTIGDPLDLLPGSADSRDQSDKPSETEGLSKEKAGR
jgi:peptidoglycan-N-acetylmuramic acid deacetylase